MAYKLNNISHSFDNTSTKLLPSIKKRFLGSKLLLFLTVNISRSFQCKISQKIRKSPMFILMYAVCILNHVASVNVFKFAQEVQNLHGF